MFERFTEKALNVVSRAQEIACKMNSEKILSEHLLLALAAEAKGVSLKIFRMYGITYEKLYDEITSVMEYKPAKNPGDISSFSHHVKILLKDTLDLASKSGNLTILYEHLFLTVINDKNSNNVNTLEKLGFDVRTARTLLQKLVQKKIKKFYHPEEDSSQEKQTNKSEETDSLLFDNEQSKQVFERAVAKLSASNYEILGTEQIISSILEDEHTPLSEILSQYGITADEFNKKLENIQSRKSEYEGRQIIFTPNAFYMMNLALQTAKELGSSVVLPEHIILGILKSKKGVAYDILKEFNINETNLAHSIIKPIEKQMPETLTILRLAKEEARRLGRNVVGTEMFLLGIIGEGAGIGGQVLAELEITIKDARKIIEDELGFGNEYYDKEVVFTERAKRVLEKAWTLAKTEHKTRIESQHLLLAITTEQDSLAMHTLEHLGVDAVEIKEGIKKFSNEQ